MSQPRTKKSIDTWDGQPIAPGTSHDVKLKIGEIYSGISVKIPLHIRRAAEPGPTVFITAALHGDEINGTGAIRELLQADDFRITRGAVILVPVLNLFAFERHSRYLPDRRDLNRSFPGNATGSLASRMAHTIFDELVMRCDFGIDLHTASIRRTNYPNVRGDMSNPAVKRIAEAFGSEIIVNNKGPRGALRREACIAGCPTVILEGGEVWKVEPAIVASATRGIRNVLRELGMLVGDIESPDYQVVIEQAKWVRADRGGFLQFHVKPGQVVEQGQELATNNTLLGRERAVLEAPFDAVVIGMTTLPAISPGEPVCHLGKLPDGIRPRDLRRMRKEEDGLERRLVHDLATNIHTEPGPGEGKH